MDPDTRGTGQPADVLAAALTAAMLPMARSTPRARSTSAGPDQVNAVIELEALSRTLAEHSRRVLMGEPVDWTEITERLDEAARTCRRCAVVEPRPRAS